MHEAAAALWGDWRSGLQNVRFERALLLPETSGRKGAAILKVGAIEALARFELHSRPFDEPESGWTLHATGEIRAGVGRLRRERIDRTAIAARCSEAVTPEAHYRACLERGVDYRGAFQSVRELRRRDGEALGQVTLAGEAGRFHAHPGLLDSCLQIMAATIGPRATGPTDTYLPVAIDELVLTEAPGTRVTSHAVLLAWDPTTPDCHRADVTLADDDGRVWGEVRGLMVRRVNAAGDAPSEMARWHYRIEWESEPRQRPAAKGSDAGANGAWLVFVDGRGLGASLAQALRDRQWPVVTVAPGPTFRQVSPTHFEIDLGDRSALGRLLHSGAMTGPITRAISLWGLEPDEETERSAQALLSQVTRGCGAITHIVQGLASSGQERLPALWIVTRFAQSTSGGEAPRALVESALWGLGRSIALEHPELWGGLINLGDGAETDGAEAESVLSAIAEIRDEDQLALRGGHRLVPRLVHRPLLIGEAPLRLRSDATYLVTGGLGTIGLAVCRWLLNRGAQNLLLTGRRPLPEGVDLKALAANGGPEARVHYAVADVVDPRAMERALGLPGLPPLRGVFHAAGVVNPRPLLETTLDDIATELGPKVAGTWVLHRITERQPLDFFVVFSSASAIWGSKHLASYGAANHFMDSLIEWRRSRGLKGLSVNWATWGGGGMLAPASIDAALQRMGLRPMAPERAMAVLEALLLGGHGRAVVADVDWGVFRPLYEQVPRRRLLEHLSVPAPASGGGPKAHLGLIETLGAMPNPEARQAAIRDFVVEQVAETLGLRREQLESEEVPARPGARLTQREQSPRPNPRRPAHRGQRALPLARRLAARAERPDRR